MNYEYDLIIKVYVIKKNSIGDQIIELYYSDQHTDNFESVIRGTQPIMFFKNKSVTKLELWGIINQQGENTFHLQDALNGTKPDF